MITQLILIKTEIHDRLFSSCRCVTDGFPQHIISSFVTTRHRQLLNNVSDCHALNMTIMFNEVLPYPLFGWL